MTTKTDAVDRYARHAKLYGTELVFETAMSELSTLQLGYLSLQLQRMYPKWRLPARPRPIRDEQRVAVLLCERQQLDFDYTEAAVMRKRQIADELMRLAPDLDHLGGVDSVEFASELIAAGETVERACRMAMISRKTLRRAATSPDGGPSRKVAVGSPEFIGQKVDKSGHPYLRGLPRDLSTSGAQNGAHASAQLGLFEVVGG